MDKTIIRKEEEAKSAELAAILAEVNTTLDRASEKLDLSETERKEVRSLAKKTLEQVGKTKQVQAPVLAGTALYMVLRSDRKVLSFQDVLAQVNGTRKQLYAIRKLYKQVMKLSEAKFAPLKASELVSPTLDRLHLQTRRGELQELAERIANVLGDEELSEGAIRSGVASAAILLAAQACGIKMTQTDLASASKISSRVIGNRSKDLKETFIRLAQLHGLPDCAHLNKDNVHSSVVQVLKLVEQQRKMEEEVEEKKDEEWEMQQAVLEQPVLHKRKRNELQEGQHVLPDEKEEPSVPLEKRARVDNEPLVGEKEQKNV